MRIWSHLLKKSLTENFILCAVLDSINHTTCYNHVASYDIKGQQSASVIPHTDPLYLRKLRFFEKFIAIHQSF